MWYFNPLSKWINVQSPYNLQKLGDNGIGNIINSFDDDAQ